MSKKINIRVFLSKFSVDKLKNKKILYTKLNILKGKSLPHLLKFMKENKIQRLVYEDDESWFLDVNDTYASPYFRKSYKGKISDLYSRGMLFRASNAHINPHNIIAQRWKQNKNKSTLKKLSKKPIGGRTLSIKDENDVKVVQKSLNKGAKRVHNHITNKVLSILGGNYELQEGESNENRFDILVKNYDGQGNDLLVEVKSSTEIPDVRMAVGQLLDYSRQLKEWQDTKLAILLPEMPSQHVIDFLDFMKIGLIWMKNNELYSCNNWINLAIKDITPIRQ